MIYEATFYYDGVWFDAIWTAEKESGNQSLYVKTKSEEEKTTIMYPRRNPFSEDRSSADSLRGFVIALYELGHIKPL
jgi:hypothetical protein